MNTESSRHSSLTLGFVRDHPRDAGRALSTLDDAELAGFVGSLPAGLGGALLEHLAPLKSSRCLQALPRERAAKALAAAPSAAAAAMLRRLLPGERKAILAAMAAAAAARIHLLLGYPPETVGSLIESDVLTFGERIAVGEAVSGARRGRRHLLTLVYILDDDHRLRGVVDVRDLLVADHGSSLQGLVRRGASALPARATLSAVAGHPGWADYDALPVADRRGVFLGVLHRAALERATHKLDSEESAGAGLSRTFFDLTELVWVAGAGVLSTALGVGLPRGRGR